MFARNDFNDFNDVFSVEPSKPIKRVDRTLAIPREVLNCFSLGSNREMYCDFTVVVDEVEFPCHRFVLNACSAFFEALFRSDMKEKREMKATIQGISAHTFQLVLDAIYTGTDVLSLETVLDVWKAAVQLQIVFLISMCEDFVTENVSVQNWYSFYWHAPILASERVVNFLNNYMITNLFEIANSDMFCNMQYEDLLNIIKSQQSTVCVDFKLDTIIKWCAASKANGKFLGDLIQVPDLSQASKEFLARLMTNELVLSNQKAITAVNKQAAQNLMNPANGQYNLVFGYAQMNGQNFNAFNFNRRVQSCPCPHCVGKSYFPC